MRDRVLAAARDAGRQPSDVRCVLNLEIAISGHCDPDPDVITGSPEQLTQQLVDLAGLGFNGFNLIPAGHDTQEQLRRIASEVLPAVRAAV
jgi:hypothetical protein